MKKSYYNLIFFVICLILILLLNSFIVNILNYIYLFVFMCLALVLFKFIFGLEKDNHRYTKEIVMNIIIILLSFFLIYYIVGIFVGFSRTTNYYNLTGFTNFVIPYLLVIIVKEYLRYQMIVKADKSKLILFLICILFIVVDLTIVMNLNSFASQYKLFMFFAVNLLPSIGTNTAATYIAYKTGYKPNILFILVIEFYAILLPIIPNIGYYIYSVIRFLLPFAIMYDVYRFFENRKNDIPLGFNSKKYVVSIPIFLILIAAIVYFTSGYFRFHAIAIASGSMMPNIHVGDVVIIDKKINFDKLKKGQVVAYKYENSIIVHRLVDIEKVDKEYYFYTKGDANNAKDDLIIKQDMFVGTVNTKIPFIGLPTVWINELL